MMTFKEFLTEIRTPERAAKLGSYLARRTDKHIKPENKASREPEIPVANISKHDPLWHLVDHLENKHDSEDLFRTFPQYVTHHDAFPISQMHPHQSTVSFEKNHFMMHKVNDRNPIALIKYKGMSKIADGHHNWFAKRLMKIKTSAAREFDLDSFLKDHPVKAEDIE